MDARTSPITDPNDLDAIVAAVLAAGGRRIETAESLPPEAYTSEAFFRLEERKIFRQEWICVGHVSQVTDVGDYFTIDMFGEHLVVVRGRDRIRVMSRLCLHRWAAVVSGSGNARSFLCPFHNWAYGLDGRLIAAPFMDRAANFDVKNCQLPEVRTEIVEALGLIFITFSDTIGSITDRIRDLIDRLEVYDVKNLVPAIPLSLQSEFNWKFAIETGMEGYHHFGTHRTTIEPDLPARLTWCEESKGTWTICHSDPSENRTDITLPVFPGLEGKKLPGLELIHIFPLTRMGVTPDRIRLQTVIPVSAGRTLRKTVYLLRPEVAADKEHVREAFRPLLDTGIGKEDNTINLMQQAAAASHMVTGGRLSHLEATVWHLREYLRDMLRTH